MVISLQGLVAKTTYWRQIANFKVNLILTLTGAVQ
jgi:hypothetical protein